MALAEEMELSEATDKLRVKLLTLLTMEDMLSQDTIEEMDSARPRPPTGSSLEKVSAP